MGMLLLSGCGDKEQDQVTEADQEILRSPTQKITINADDFMAGQIEALNKAKDVEGILLEASKSRLKSIE